jgi:predicted nucleic acid-binding protein
MILVDTSAWIEFFRGREPVASMVDELLEANEVALCGPVVTELYRGLRAAERRKVMPLFAACHHLDQPSSFWEDAGELGSAAGRRGATVKSLDLLIATYALAHSVPLLSTDKDFITLERAGIPLVLVRS